MIVRLTFCKFLPQHIAEAKRIYKEEITPIVKRQKGNMGIKLLEPADKKDDFISITEWKTLQDAEAYHTTGAYKKLISKLDGFFLKEPTLKTYTVEKISEPLQHLL
ncbi:MAG TPA: antibiotic biosynthesis monooxygenase [Flavisolibacter sp.]|nr:antibiotic biosynthesis monooxygenase [Flavisolibacter sp.]